MKIHWILSSFIVLSMAACSPKVEDAASQTSESTAKEQADSEKPAVSQKIEEGAADEGAIPAEFKTKAFEFYGLTGKKTQTLDQDGKTGDSTRRYLGMVDGYPTFEILRSGGLEALGGEKVSVRKDGIYSLSVGSWVLDKPSLQLPSDFKIGTKWTSSASGKSPMGDLKMTSTSEVVGQEKVTTPAGTFDAYVIVSDAKLESPQKQSVKAKIWMVKGTGFVLQKVTASSPDGKSPQNMTIRLIK